jgi:hypothetical protein
VEPGDDNRWTSSGDAFQELKQAHAAVVDEFLDPETKLPNVVGLGIGIRLVGGNPELGILGEPTGEPVLQVFVTRKLPREALAENDLIPGELAGKPTDVIESGRPTLSQHIPQRFRPVRGGCSVSAQGGLGTGTIATGVVSLRGDPKILSCNHVLAALNALPSGTSILQPGAADGGSFPGDVIGGLDTFEPLDIFPPVPLAQHDNLIDAATADVDGGFGAADSQIHWIGHLQGYTTANFHLIGRQVKKTGRTTGYRTGTIIGINATLDIPAGLNSTIRFKEVIQTTKINLRGDSGALLTTWDNIAVGLLFADSRTVTFHNPIEHVQRLLNLRVAETFVPPPPPP